MNLAPCPRALMCGGTESTKATLSRDLRPLEFFLQFPKSSATGGEEAILHTRQWESLLWFIHAR